MDPPRTPGTALAARVGRDAVLAEVLRRHPRVTEVRFGAMRDLEFSQGDWARSVEVGNHDCENYGLIELIDNNPLVCADAMSVPTAASTLALIALGPVALAGILEGPVNLAFNFAFDEDDVVRSLEAVGFKGEVKGARRPGDQGDLRTCHCRASLVPGVAKGDLAALYDERFEKSFFVWSWSDPAGCDERARNSSSAYYSLAERGSDGICALEIHVAADARGKCGALQIVHAMNVMAGIEESLGVQLPD